MFSELKIEVIDNDGRPCIDLADLLVHLTSAMISYNEELKANPPTNPAEYYYAHGILMGIRETVMFLGQGGLEIEFEKSVHTVDDLLNFR